MFHSGTKMCEWLLYCFFFNDTATTEIYTLSLHDALPICSLDMGSLNMGSRVFINTPDHLQTMALAIREAGVLPELEVFETGHLLLAKKFIEAGYVKGPGMFQI